METNARNPGFGEIAAARSTGLGEITQRLGVVLVVVISGSSRRHARDSTGLVEAGRGRRVVKDPG